MPHPFFYLYKAMILAAPLPVSLDTISRIRRSHRTIAATTVSSVC